MFRTVLRPALQTFRRQYSSAPKGSKSDRSQLALITVGFPLAGVGLYFLFDALNARQPKNKKYSEIMKASDVKPAVDYKAVANDVAALLESNLDYDGIGHYGPVLVRLAWHASGTYDVASKTGGSDGATMRFDPEAKFGANAGLQIARDLLEPIKKKYGDSLSYGDLWTLAGVVAVKQMGGPSVPWRPGRVDAKDGSKCPPDGRLPDASKDQKHVREIFGRMGFNDQEMVALCGAHALGKCHTDRSGFKGPWTFSPVSFTNAYFTELLNQKWVKKTTDEIVKDGKHVKTEWRGPEQFVDEKTGSLMMLKTDLALIKDPQFKHWVDIYAKDQSKFFEDFSKAFAKLLELGVSDKVLGNKPVNF